MHDLEISWNVGLELLQIQLYFESDKEILVSGVWNSRILKPPCPELVGASTAYGMTFFAKVFSDYYPESKYRKWVWGASIAGTTAGAYFRAKSGKHFPTDVIIGSAVGGAFGYFIPHFHKKRDGKALSFQPTSNGLSLTYKLK